MDATFSQKRLECHNPNPNPKIKEVQRQKLSRIKMAINEFHPFASSVHANAMSGMISVAPQAVSKPQYVQVPIAVVGMACRLPGHCNNPVALWEFLKRGGIAHNEAPESRFNLDAHHDGSRKPKVRSLTLVYVI